MEIIAALMLVIACISLITLLVMLWSPQIILDLSDGALPPSRKSVLKFGVPVVVISLAIAGMLLHNSIGKSDSDSHQDELDTTMVQSSSQSSQTQSPATLKEGNGVTDAELAQMLQQAQHVIEQHESEVSAKK